MKHLFAILILASSATASAQTIRTLGYNTTNGQIAYSGTNVLTFTNNVTFSNVTVSGTLTVDTLDTTIDAGEGNSTEFRSPINFDDIRSEDIVEKTRTNLGLGTTNSVFFRALDLADGLTIGDNTNSAIYFEGNSAATTRTNLGLPLAALTNTNVTNFRAALGLEVTNGYSVYFAGRLWDGAASEQGLVVEDNEILVGAATANTNAPTNTTNAVRWINVIAGTNTYKLPLYQ